MGLIKAALGAAGGVAADQWKDFFACDSLPADVLVARGVKRSSGRSSNTKGSDDIITNGSLIVVADGQCMVIVDQGKVVDICAEPGEYVYDMSTEPSIFYGNLSETIPAVLQNIGKRFTFGGEPPKTQRVYYFNTKELMGNKYGTPNPVQFKVVDESIGLRQPVSLKCFGEYSYRITNPVAFYTNVCANVEWEYTRAEIDSQLKSELLTALQPALAQISRLKIMYDEIPLYTKDLAKALNDELSESWGQQRGIEIVNFGVSSVSITEEDDRTIKELVKNATMFGTANQAAAQLAGAQARAMQDAANNQGGMGAMGGFFGMGMAQQAGGANVANLFAMGQQQAAQAAPAQPAAPAADAWTCSCGAQNTGKFCANCGTPKPAPAPAAGTWTCSCGTQNTGKFCSNCGTPKPASDEWTCGCGAVNTGKFCANCGTQRPQ